MNKPCQSSFGMAAEGLMEKPHDIDICSKLVDIVCLVMLGCVHLNYPHQRWGHVCLSILFCHNDQHNIYFHHTRLDSHH